MLKVLHIGKYYPPFHGGIENFLCDLAECQLEQGDVEPSVLVHQHKGGRAEETETANSVFVRRVRIIGRAVFTPLAPLFLRSLNRTIEERNPDILHLHLPNPSTFWCLFSKSARKRPWVIHWHSDVLGGQATWKVRMWYPLYQIFESKIIKRTSLIICTSPPYLSTSTPLAAYKEKCIVVPLGIRDINLNRASHRYQATLLAPHATDESTTRAPSEAAFRLIIIGRLTYYKGHDLLLRALVNLPNVTLDIIGTGELERDIRDKINKLHLADRVTLHGNLDKDAVNQMLVNSDLLCLPSTERAEAFGLVIVEASRVATPSLVTNVKGSGMAWVVEDNVTGAVVSANNHEAIAQKLIQLNKDRQWLRLAGEAARSRFLNHFLIEKSSVGICNAYWKSFAKSSRSDA